MANFTQTITNTVRCFGQGPSSKWSDYAWNAFKWGEGTTDIKTDVRHLLTAQTVTPSDGYAQKKVYHRLTAQTISPDTTLYRAWSYRIHESVIVVGDMGSEGLRDGAGYFYVFPDRVTEGEDRSFATWSEASASATTWTAAAAASTTWSEQ